MRKPIRYYRVSVTVPHDLMQTMFELLQNEDAHDFRMMELGPDGQAPKPMQAASPAIVNPVNPGPSVNPRTGRTYSRNMNWAKKHWSAVEPLFKSLNGQSINYKDMRLIEAIVSSGMSPSSVSTTMSGFVANGLLVRSGHGEYKLP